VVSFLEEVLILFEGELLLLFLKLLQDVLLDHLHDEVHEVTVVCLHSFLDYHLLFLGLLNGPMQFLLDLARLFFLEEAVVSGLVDRL